LVQDRGGAEFHTGGILLYVEDLKRGTNKEVGPKDIFEMGSKETWPSFRPLGPAARREDQVFNVPQNRPVLFKKRVRFF